MTLALVLSKATGALYPAPAGDNKPTLTGFVEFELDGQKKLRLEVAAWVKDNGKKFYSLSAGGISASLFPETNKKSDEHPDYTGTFGNNRELRLAAWKKMSKGPNSQPYLSISIEPKTASSTTTAQQTDTGQTQRQTSGVPSPNFDFV